MKQMLVSQHYTYICKSKTIFQTNFTLTSHNLELALGFQRSRRQFMIHFLFLSGSAGNLNIRNPFSDLFEHLKAAQPTILN